MATYILTHSFKGTIWKKHKYVAKKPKKNGKGFNYYYRKVVDAYDTATANNIYDVDSWNYDEKMAEIAKTEEWQNIIARGDPEYVKRDKNGNIYADIDDYLVKKKHPELDVLDDMINGRDITINKVTKQSAAAAVNDYVKVGAMYLGLATTALITGHKVRQGSYDKQIQSVKNNVSMTVNAAQQDYKKISEGAAVAKAVLDVYDSANTVSTINKTVQAYNDRYKEDKKA